MTFRGLAAAVVERLEPYTPKGLEFREAPEGFLQVWIDDERCEAYPLDAPALEPEIDLALYDPPLPAFGVLEAIDFVQEWVGAELDDDWAAATGEPWAELADDEIRFGYAEGVTFDAILLSAIVLEL
jgi:hypothetical protein